MKKLLILLSLFFFQDCFLFGQTGNQTEAATSDTTLIYKFDIKKDIGPVIWRQTMVSFNEAHRLDADYILINMNTYGGLVESADSIRTMILNSDIPVWCFINDNAASAGALIAIACDSIYMRKGGSIGAATVVDQSGKPVPDKYQSYMRSKMRSTAESHGSDTIISGNDTIVKWFRNPKIAEAMVDPDLSVEGVIDSGKVLTFTASEAIKHGFCEGQAETIEEVIALTGIKNYTIKEYKLSAFEKTMSFLINPIFHGLMIMLIIGGIYFELQSPGVGFPLAVAVFGAIFYFAPLYLEGLAEYWEIIVFVVGLILIAIEVFAIPGFGVAGISGIALVVIGLTFSLIDNVVFEFESADVVSPVVKSLILVLFSMIIAIGVSIYLTNKFFGTSGLLSFLSLQDTQQKTAGYVGVDSKQTSLVGKTGIVSSMLRPSGKVEIDDDIYDAMAMESFIEKGEAVIVIRHESYQLYVKKA